MSNIFALTLNCGSSTLKFSVVDFKKNKELILGMADFLCSSGVSILWKTKTGKYNDILHKQSNIEEIIDFISYNILKSNIKIFNNIVCIGHRVVHGGSKLRKSVIIDKKIIKHIEHASIFAPLHNPINLLGIQASFNIFPHLKKKNVAVFDTAFHSTLPKRSYLYGIPYGFYKDYGIRRYGAHGISYSYVTNRSSEILKISRHRLNIIACHLGNGASIAAIRNGVCLDTSMGLTPLEGLIMGTRSGDIDPSIIFFMYKKLKMSIKEIENILIKKSGLLGISELSSDFRILESNYLSCEKVKLSIEVFCYRLSKYIASYTTLMQGKLDAIVFTGGIGENSCLVREITISRLSILNCNIDIKLNTSMISGKEGFINSKNSISILVIPTNEALVIAKESVLLFKKSI